MTRAWQGGLRDVAGELCDLTFVVDVRTGLWRHGENSGGGWAWLRS